MHDEGWKTDDAVIQKALKKVRKLTGLHGRWEIVQYEPLIVLDVAHNEDGMRQVVQQIELTDHAELHIILGLVKDKEIDRVLEVLPSSAHYYFTQAHIPRALNTETLQQKAKTHNLNGNNYPDVNTALYNALNKADKDDMILVCGSVFLVGEINAVPILRNT